MLRYHHTLFPNEEKPQINIHHSYNGEVGEGNEFLKPSGHTQKSYADTQTRFVAVLSMNPDHTSNSAIEYMELLIQQPLIKEVFQNPGVEIVEFKCDNGSHFISGETLHYAVVTLPKLLKPKLPKLQQVLYAPFTPRHGKTDLDRFFG